MPMLMSAWWGRKCNSNRSKEEEHKKLSKKNTKREKEKPKSFDEVRFAHNRDHPLPRPTVSSSSSASTAFDHHAMVDLGLGSGSVSSVSSSGSSDEQPADLGFVGVRRYSDSFNTLRNGSISPQSQKQHISENGHLVLCSPVPENSKLLDFSASPNRQFQLCGSDAPPASGCSRGSMEIKLSPRSRSPCPGSRGNAITGPSYPLESVISPESSTGRQDDGKSPRHRLPLPPSSPTSPSSHALKNNCTNENVQYLQSRWKKGKLLGRGTFGHVYVGFNSESGQMCAIKEVRVISDDQNSKESLKQLGQEITLLSQLSHPNIVQYHGSELAEDTLSVYLEYVSGGSIHKLLQEYGPFKEPVIRSYTRQILSGLAYLHGRNTVHRDIKGANILVDPNGEIKLADFGMAKHITSHTSMLSFKGSPYWMAPEVIMNSNGYNLSVDIWSLGCTILEMATSKPPWSQYEGVAAIFKIGNSKELPEMPDNLSNDAKSFLKLCLQRDLSARPTAAQLLDHPFIRDQAATKVAKFNLIKDTLPSSFDTTSTRIEFHSNIKNYRSLDGDYRMKHAVGYSSPFKSSSDQVRKERVNMSLPVSPCSSPLRQYGPSHISFLTPPHPAYKMPMGDYGLTNYLSSPTNANSNYPHPWPDISQPKALTPDGSPRRRPEYGSYL
eukprot:TRINITY_DN22928_c0_g1_i1.p1 TRINITY_DN22928_c0_g1~~TRINITY_DN22928_c0_g1_i1.p1  ORF type:complete len:666 (-),score=98.33 TRINITY_DN22928_c0_g1_i1:407-2404(-)